MRSPSREGRKPGEYREAAQLAAARGHRYVAALRAKAKTQRHAQTATKHAERSRRRSSSPTGAPILAWQSQAAKWLRRRREEQATTRGQVGAPGKLLGACTASFVSLRFCPVSLCFETALCLNATIPFITNLALLRESYTLALITD